MSVISRILVVEDEVMLLFDLVDNLADFGIDSLPLTIADGAAPSVLNCDIDALITDIELPGTMNGLDLAWRCAQLRPDLPIVVVSAGIRPTRAQLPPGAVFIAKPYGIAQVLTALERPAQKVAA